MKEEVLGPGGRTPVGSRGALLMEKVTGRLPRCLNRVLPCIWNLGFMAPVPPGPEPQPVSVRRELEMMEAHSMATHRCVSGQVLTAPGAVSQAPHVQVSSRSSCALPPGKPPHFPGHVLPDTRPDTDQPGAWLPCQGHCGPDLGPAPGSSAGP